MSFQDGCRELMAERHQELLAEFESKKHCTTILEAYGGDRKQAYRMMRKFKAAGLVQTSWKRSCGLLLVDGDYRRRYRKAHKDEFHTYTLRWLLRKKLPDVLK